MFEAISIRYNLVAWMATFFFSPLNQQLTRNCFICCFQAGCGVKKTQAVIAKYITGVYQIVLSNMA